MSDYIIKKRFRDFELLYLLAREIQLFLKLKSSTLDSRQLYSLHSTIVLVHCQELSIWTNLSDFYRWNYAILVGLWDGIPYIAAWWKQLYKRLFLVASISTRVFLSSRSTDLGAACNCRQKLQKPIRFTIKNLNIFTFGTLKIQCKNHYGEFFFPGQFVPYLDLPNLLGQT